MIYQGNAITVARSGDDIATLTFDLKEESINKLSSAVVTELEEAVKALQAEGGLAGLVIGSAKDVFIVGADITEFHGIFGKGQEYLVEMNLRVHDIFNAIEDLPFPTVTAINGLALGGGIEYARGNTRLGFDYAWKSLGTLGSTNFLTFSVGW